MNAIPKIYCYFSLLLLLVASSTRAQDSFGFVVLPDTQSYMEEYPDIYLSQMEWLVANKDRFSFVLHEGDITQNNSPQEWKLAKQGFDLLNGKLPYSFVLGNHDMGSGPGAFADTRNTTMANHFFDIEELAENANLIDSYPKGKVDNLCSSFILNGQKWLVLSLEFGPREKTIAWADSIIGAHPGDKVILNTHAYLYSDSTLQDGDDWWQPQDYGIGNNKGGESVNNGGQLWDKLVKKHENILMVFSGHILKSGVGRLVSTGDHGNKVYQMLANYQKGVDGSQKGGDGFLRIITVNSGKKTISVKTYSPYLDAYKTGEKQEFVFKNVNI